MRKSSPHVFSVPFAVLNWNLVFVRACRKAVVVSGSSISCWVALKTTSFQKENRPGCSLLFSFQKLKFGVIKSLVFSHWHIQWKEHLTYKKISTSFIIHISSIREEKKQERTRLRTLYPTVGLAISEDAK